MQNQLLDPTLLPKITLTYSQAGAFLDKASRRLAAMDKVNKPHLILLSAIAPSAQFSTTESSELNKRLHAYMFHMPYNMVISQMVRNLATRLDLKDNSLKLAVLNSWLPTQVVHSPNLLKNCDVCSKAFTENWRDIIATKLHPEDDNQYELTKTHRKGALFLDEYLENAMKTSIVTAPEMPYYLSLQVS